MLAVYQYRTVMDRWVERTGPIRAWAEDDAEGHCEAAGRLHEHHWDAEGADVRDAPCMRDLGRVLECGKEGRGHAEERGPQFELG